MKIHLLGGFLGSGKTTAIEQAAGILLQQGVRTGVISNDQGQYLVDNGFFHHRGIPGRQVLNGCFCCNYRQLDESIASLLEQERTDIIFAEAVGSCTDMVATVLKPLIQFRPGAQVTLSVLADARLLQLMLQDGAALFDPAVAYIYFKQLEEAAIIVVTKIDLLQTAALAALKKILGKRFEGKAVLYQNSLNADCIRHWLQVLDEFTPAQSPASLAIDYAVYGQGEAAMGWVDQLLELYSSPGKAMADAELLLNKICHSVKAHRYPIGHIKFLVNDAVKAGCTTGTDTDIVLPAWEGTTVNILINARVQAAPAQLLAIIARCIESIETTTGCRIVVNNSAAFQPGFPKPAHRFE